MKNLTAIFPSNVKLTTYKEQLSYLISHYPYSFFKLLKTRIELAELRQFIDKQTAFIDFDASYSFRCYCVLHNITKDNTPKCKTCNKNLFLPKYFGSITVGFKQFCNNNCSNKNADKREKIKQIFLKTLGTTTPLANKRLRKIGVQTRLKKHNGKYLSDKQIKDFVDKSRDASVKDKIKTTRKIKLYKSFEKNKFIEPQFSLDDFLTHYKTQQTQDYDFLWKCKKCQNIFKSQVNFEWNNHHKVAYARCMNCYPRRSRYSHEEGTLYQYISTLTSYTIIRGARKELKINDSFYEIDIYIPQLKLGFEYDGIFFHRYSIDTDLYHLNKTKIAEERGIKLVHIRSDEWLNNTDAIKAMIKNMVNNTVVFENTDILELDRAKYNKCWNHCGYKLIGETAPEIIEVKKNSHECYCYQTCGKLIYKKVNSKDENI